VVNSTGIGGRRTLEFTLARENWLAVTNAAVRSMRGGASTIIAVATTTGNTENLTDNAGGAIAVWPGFHNGMMVYKGASFAYLASDHWARDDGGPHSYASYAGVTWNTPFVATSLTEFASATAWSSTSFYNGAASAASTATDPAPNGTSDLRIGQGNVSPATTYRYRLEGKIGEILIFNRALNTTERQQVERYLGWKWGITVP
jgi:hypothetical protein